ncbi:hypothetical protein ABW19_dt0201097 [Dactylella cylindrospora]|nr:hypothetical protein ABW19_dt0201097 [Dactylella cylindrospora]
MRLILVLTLTLLASSTSAILMPSAVTRQAGDRTATPAMVTRAAIHGEPYQSSNKTMKTRLRKHKKPSRRKLLYMAVIANTKERGRPSPDSPPPLSLDKHVPMPLTEQPHRDSHDRKEGLYSSVYNNDNRYRGEGDAKDVNYRGGPGTRRGRRKKSNTTGAGGSERIPPKAPRIKPPR